MEFSSDIIVINYEKHKISYNEDENIYYFSCSEVKEFRNDNYILFNNQFEGIKTTFELIDSSNEGFLYNAIGHSGIIKPCKLLAIRD